MKTYLFKTRDLFLKKINSVTSKIQINYLNSVLLIFTFSSLRARSLFYHPSFWAEDGTYFFKDSLELGFKSVFTPVIGHYFTIPRFLAYLATFLPIKWIPLFYIISAGLITSLCLAYFVKDGFTWILEKKSSRLLLALLFAMLPGSTEVYFSYSSTCYTFYFFCCLFFLEKYEGSKTNSLIREILFSLIWFSSGQGIVFLPILLFDIVKRNYFRFISLTTLLISVFLNIKATQSVSETWKIKSIGFEQIPDVLRIYFDNFFMRLLYKPLLGEKLARIYAQLNNFIFYGLSIAFLFYVFYRILKKVHLRNKSRLISIFDSQELKLFLVLIFSFCTFLIIAIVRFYSSSELLRENMFIISRYSFQPYAMALILWIGFYKSFDKNKLNTIQKSILNSFLLLVFVNAGTISHFGSQKFEDFEKIWPQRSQEIEEAISSKKIESEIIIGPIPCRPPGWGNIDKIIIK